MSRRIVVLLVALLVINCVLIGVFVFIRKSQQQLPLQQASLKPQQVQIISTIPSVKVQLSNESFLKERLSSIHFWDANVVAKYNDLGQEGITTARSLTIVLVDNKQPFGQITQQRPNGDRYVFTSFKPSYDTSGNVTIFMHLDPKFTMSLDNQKLSTFVSWMTLYSVYDLAHPLMPSMTEDQRLKRGVTDFTKDIDPLPNRTFVTVTK